MLTPKASRFSVAAWFVVGLTLTVQADTITLAPSMDNTLIEFFGGTPYSNALGDGIYSGRVGKMGGAGLWSWSRRVPLGCPMRCQK